MAKVNEKLDFLDFEWHDAIIKKIDIDRSDSGNNDIIIFDIEFPDGNRKKVEFQEVYQAQFNMNFGVIADECIADVDIETKLDDAFMNKWNNLLGDLSDFRIITLRTSSTSSVFKITAKNVVIK